MIESLQYLKNCHPCIVTILNYGTVEPLYDGHHWEPTFYQVSLTQGFLYVLVGMVCVYRAVVAAFSVRWQGRLNRGYLYYE